jgi:hypothetical protein
MNGLHILDVGNTKVANLMNSIRNSVTALVLERPIDDISKVDWRVQDISKRLNFENETFDIFTSPSSLHLIGQGRYGDRKNPTVLLDFIEELKRIMKSNSKMYLLLPLGRDLMLYGFHFIYSLDTIKKIFKDWNLIDYLVDDEVKFGTIKNKSKKTNRFDKDVSIKDFEIGDYKIIYLEFQKK